MSLSSSNRRGSLGLELASLLTSIQTASAVQTASSASMAMAVRQRWRSSSSVDVVVVVVDLVPVRAGSLESRMDDELKIHTIYNKLVDAGRSLL